MFPYVIFEKVKKKLPLLYHEEVFCAGLSLKSVQLLWRLSSEGFLP